MKILDQFPHHAAGGADIMGDGRLKKNERVVLLPRETDDLPRGSLCLKESLVLSAVKKLGYTIADDELENEIDDMRAELVRLREIADRFDKIQGVALS